MHTLNEFLTHRFRLKGKLAAMILIAACAGNAWADGLKSLENFMRETRSGRTEFTQVVTAPARTGEVARSKVSSGTFAFARPGKFRFDYTKPFEQSIVADGQTLWLHDAGLNQVTARKQASALGSTPAALIAAAPDLRALRADFVLAAEPAAPAASTAAAASAEVKAEPLQWVSATPKDKEGQLQLVRVGFRGNALAVLEILDTFGQRSVLTFAKFDTSSAVPAGFFDFKPPAGADVIRQ